MTVRRIATAVTASLAVVREAARAGVDALLVHHGWFWRGEDPRVIGPRRQRLGAMLAADINLFAYHLPLDAHPTLGNNAQLGRVMGWPSPQRSGNPPLLCVADLPQPQSAAQIEALLAQRLRRDPQVVGDVGRPVRRIAWCTGAAQDMIDAAIDAGADAFVSGEISERTTHSAREAGMLYFAAGHHATELYGVQALGEQVARRFGLAHRFIDDPNPV